MVKSCTKLGGHNAVTFITLIRNSLQLIPERLYI